MIIAMIPIGAVLGFIGGLLIVIVVGLIARSAFSAEHPGGQGWQLLGALPGLGTLIGAIVAPILYGRSAGRRTSPPSHRRRRDDPPVASLRLRRCATTTVFLLPRRWHLSQHVDE
jgi:hypothetical protein